MMADVIAQLLTLDRQAQKHAENFPKKKKQLKKRYDEMKKKTEAKSRAKLEADLTGYQNQLEEKLTHDQSEARKQYAEKRQQLEAFVNEQKPHYVQNFMEKVKKLGSEV